MTTTRPWLDDPTLREANDLAALLDAGRELGTPPEGAKDALWARLELAAVAAGAGAAAGGLAGSSTASLVPGSGALGVGSTTATTVATGTITAATTAAATTAAATTMAASAGVAAAGGVLATIGGKLAVVAMVSAIGIGGAKLALDARSSSPPAEHVEAHAAARTTIAPLRPARSDEALAPHADPVDASSPATVTPTAAEPSFHALAPTSGRAKPTSLAASAPKPAPSAGSPLVLEAEGVARAREALRSGRAAESLAILGELDRTIRGGALGQERAIYAIEALAATGRTAEAQQAAQAFLATNPSSPYAARIERFVAR